MALLLEASAYDIQVLLLLEHLIEFLERAATVIPAISPAAVSGGIVGAGELSRVSGGDRRGLGLDGAGLDRGCGGGHGDSGWHHPVQEASCCGHGPSLLVVQRWLSNAAG